MRTLLLAVALLLVPIGTASAPRAAWHLDWDEKGSGVVGEPIQLSVAARFAENAATGVGLRVPPIVKADGALNWTFQPVAERTHRHTWTLVPVREGFWAYELVVLNGASESLVTVGGPFRASHDRSDARMGTDFPQVAERASVHSVGGNRFNVSYEVEALGGWLRFARLEPRFGDRAEGGALAPGAVSGPSFHRRPGFVNMSATYELAPGTHASVEVHARATYDLWTPDGVQRGNESVPQCSRDGADEDYADSRELRQVAQGRARDASLAASITCYAFDSRGADGISFVTLAQFALGLGLALAVAAAHARRRL